MSGCVNKLCVGGIEIDKDGITCDSDLTITASKVKHNGGVYNINTTVHNSDSDYTVKASDHIIIIENEGTADRYIHLPSINSESIGQTIIIKRLYPIMDYHFIVKPSIGDKIDNISDAVYPLDDSHECVELLCSSISWIVISSYGN